MCCVPADFSVSEFEAVELQPMFWTSHSTTVSWFVAVVGLSWPIPCLSVCCLHISSTFIFTNLRDIWPYFEIYFYK